MQKQNTTPLCGANEHGKMREPCEILGAEVLNEWFLVIRYCLRHSTEPSLAHKGVYKVHPETRW